MSDEWEEQELVLEQRPATSDVQGVLWTSGEMAGSRGRTRQRGMRGGRGLRNDSGAGYGDDGNKDGGYGRRGGSASYRGGGRGLRNDSEAGYGDDGNQAGGNGRRGGSASYRGGSQRGSFGSGGGGRGSRNDSGDGYGDDGNQDGGNGRKGGSTSFKEPTPPYIPPPLAEDEETIFSHYPSGINFSKYDEIKVDVSGSDPPAAILTFEEAQLCESLKTNVAKSGYVTPTKVQKHSIPIIAAGRDIMACAQTGSGKTAAFLLPILQNLMASGVASSAFSGDLEPEAIVVAPTRELITQIYMEARKFSYGTCVRPGIVYGGVNTSHQLGNLSKGCNVLCGTPGKLLYVINNKKVGLSKIRYLVLDEADRMLGMGFEEDMRTLVGFPSMPPREVRQTMMFSATYPESIQRLAADFLKKDYLFLAVGKVGAACADVEQTFIRVKQYSKRDQLLEILKSSGDERTLVFVERKRQADFIAAFLCQEDVRATTIHGDRLQRDREQALADFRSGRCPVLVATSVASRGLDIPDVQCVVNFDLPDTIDDYVHRIGRTGRCGNTGRALSFYDEDADGPLARALVQILSSAQQTVPDWLADLARSASGMSNCNLGVSKDSREGGGFRSDQFRPDQAAAPSMAVEEAWD